MLDRLLSIMPNGNKRYPVVYDRMINSLNERIQQMKNRFLLGNPTFTTGVELLRFFILNIDLDQILAYQSDIDKFSNIIDFVKNTYLGAYDPIYKGKVECNLFMYNQGKRIPEFIMNTEFDNKVVDYPFDAPFSEWNKLRATRIIHHDSKELVSDLHTWWITFTELYPTYILISLDVTTLIFKWVKYVEQCRASNTEEDAAEFLRASELVHWHDDLFNIWLINIINDILNDSTRETKDILDSITVNRYISTDATVRNGLEQVIIHRNLVKDNQLRVQDFLATEWINGRSFFDVIQEQQRYVALPMLRQYRWLDIIRWMPYLRSIIYLNRYFPDVGMNKTIRERAKDILNRDLKFQSLENSLIIPSAKEKLKKDYEEIQELCQ